MLFLISLVFRTGKLIVFRYIPEYEIIRIVILDFPIASVKFLVMRTDSLVARFDSLVVSTDRLIIFVISLVVRTGKLIVFRRNPGYEIIRIVLLDFPIASLKFLVMRTDILVALFDFPGC